MSPATFFNVFKTVASPKPGWVEVTVESETGVPLGKTWIYYYDSGAVHKPGECVQRVLDDEELQKSFFEKYAGKLCGKTSSGNTENSRNLVMLIL